MNFFEKIRNEHYILQLMNDSINYLLILPAEVRLLLYTEHKKVAFFKYNAISNVHVIILVGKFDFDDFNLKRLLCCSW